MTKIPMTKILEKNNIFMFLTFGHWIIGIYLGFGIWDLVIAIL